MGLADGQAMLNRVMKDTFPVAITYSRVVSGTTFTAALTGWLGNTLFAGLTEQSVSVQWGETDVLLLAADLVLNGQRTTPHAGDRLAFALDGVAVVFVVAAPDASEPAWKWSNFERTRLRLHCQRVV